MKKFIYIFLLTVSLGISSCSEDFLNQVPNDRLTIDQVFQRREESERYLYGVYSYIRDESNQWNSNPWMGGSDEADMTWARGGYNSYFMNIGSWDATSGFFNFWTHYYQGIRTATYFMQRIGENEEILRLPEGRQLITQYVAEARALRAYFYFCIIRQYGPAIILNGEEVIPPDLALNDIQLPRNSFDECVAYIVSELELAEKDLPDWYGQDREYGRLTKVFTQSVKARILLYAASPLFNGNTDYADFKNSDGKVLINQSYDPNKWKQAASAAKVLIDNGRFGLFRQNDETGNLDPFLSCQNVLLTPWNKEILFARVENGLQDFERHAAPRFGGGWSGIGVTQNMVDAYHMANGKNIEDPESGYIEEGFSEKAGKYTKEKTYNMWTNREPRFYVGVVYNGSQWMNTSDGIKTVELFNKGNTGKSGSYDHSATGYLVRKNVDPNSNPRINRFSRRPLVYFRLGEMYLNYVEALNEVDPGNPDILLYLNMIRERGGIPGLKKGLSQDIMRQEIRNERQVELAFEYHRYFDTRRWKIAEQTDAGPFYGMNVDAGNSVNDPDFYKRTVYETRVFKKAFYFFPMPQSEIDRNKKLQQNPGW
ncbi:RagB/SusD family nutrient uptake outer membrane protein [Dyadobacter tibetensis]|uniref:RagB/SusD family nutrient uptake outer membrane protein n=1 Tax=Dyadobacter tibetensis TaxID=1211851 RepID=UPI00047206DA|nr:RagB/SusD family nutrient uptake outer membrane protein [Dyadobacter tibetensis]